MRKSMTLELDDRGTKLNFKITEMPATQLESWILRALLLLAGCGADVPDGSDLNAAASFLKGKGISALSAIDFEKAKPLLEELLNCCERILPSGALQKVESSTVDGYISDVRTLFKLKLESAKFNLSFFNEGGIL